MAKDEIYIVFLNKPMYAMNREINEPMKWFKDSAYHIDAVKDTELEGKLDELVKKGDAIYTDKWGKPLHDLNNKVKGVKTEKSAKNLKL